MGVIRWEAPPPRNVSAGGRGKAGIDWGPIAAELRSRPGEWALAVTFEAGNLAAQIARLIRRADMTVFGPAGSFEATARKVDGEGRVYVRYVGAGSSTENGEPR